MKIKLFFFLILICSYNNPKEILINSVPKCGSFLLVRCLELITKKEFVFFNDKTLNNLHLIPKNSLFFKHLKYSTASVSILKHRNIKGAFIYRDPRDQIVSHAFWIYKHKLFKSYGFEKDVRNVKLSDVITELIRRSKKFYGNYIPWIGNPLFFSIKYENLVGVKGGGNAYNQCRAIMGICNHLKIELNSKILKNCVEKLYGEGITFRKGKIGSWKKYFTKEHKDLFKKLNGSLLIGLGYEKNNNW